MMNTTRRAAGLVAVVLAALAGGAAPAAADAGIEIEAGYVDGQIVPGRPVPVRVQVRSDQLATGTLTATSYTLGEPGDTATAAVEVAGGSVKDYLMVVPTSWNGGLGPSEIRVSLRAGDDTIEATTNLSWSGAVEIVGLLPGAVPQPPDPVALDRGLGRAVFHQLDDLELATPGALAPLGSIVAGPGGLSGLPEASQRNVLEWIDGGGQLLVDAPAGSAVAGLPSEWQPAGSRVTAGEGWVRLTGGAAGRGQWAAIVEPTRQFSANEMNTFGWCCFAGIPDAVARDAGLRIPEVGWLLGFLAAYVIVVGPVTFVLLRRARRTTLAWVAVPVVAVLFTGVAFTAGRSLRSGSQAAHGSLVQASPLGDQVVSYVGLVSRDGSDPTALFPDGWQAGGFDPGDLGEMMGPFPGPAGPSARTQPVPVHGDDGRPGVRLPLSAGDFGVVTGRGRLAETGALAVTATAAADGTVSGTVSNDSDIDLEQVIVVVADRAVGVGDLPAGEATGWTLETGSGHRADADPWRAVEQPWSGAIGDAGEPDLDSIVNYAVYATEVGRDVDTYPPGMVVAAGWTTGWQPPVDVGSGLAGGRTGVVARSAVVAEPGAVPAAAVRREFVRGPGVTTFDPPIIIPEWGDATGAVVRFTLPDGADPATPLVLDAASGVVHAEVWDGRDWAPVDLAVPADGGQPAVDVLGPPRQAQLPAGAVQDGVVYVRVAVSQELATRVMLEVRGET